MVLPDSIINRGVIKANAKNNALFFINFLNIKISHVKLNFLIA